MNEIQIIETKYPSLRQLSIWLLKLDDNDKLLKEVTEHFKNTALTFISEYEDFVEGDTDTSITNTSVPFAVSVLEQFYSYNAGLKALGNAVVTVNRNRLYFEAESMVNPTTNKKYSQADKKEIAGKEVAGLESLVNLLNELTFTIKEKLNTFKSTRASKY